MDEFIEVDLGTFDLVMPVFEVTQGGIAETKRVEGVQQWYIKETIYGLQTAQNEWLVRSATLSEFFNIPPNDITPSYAANVLWREFRTSFDLHQVMIDDLDFEIVHDDGRFEVWPRYDRVSGLSIELIEEQVA